MDIKNNVKIISNNIKSKVYYKNVQAVASLSKLFASSTSAPFIQYRMAENIFCDTLEAQNLGRLDIAIDAILDNIGIGIKTFLDNNKRTYQKVAEFNKAKSQYEHLDIKNKVIKISELRNARLDLAKDTYSLKDLYYHCITRDKNNLIYFYTVPMDHVDIKNIRDINASEASISFNDGINEYSFNLSKSTLFKKFNLDLIDPERVLEVKILDNPVNQLISILGNESTKITSIKSIEDEKDFVVLPLYSYSRSKGKFVPERSALNQWNASGRKRSPDEAYISISSKIHKHFYTKYPDSTIKFFPSRDQAFNLILPNNTHLEAKICQDNSKALMTNPNKDLGKWLLRTVLNLKENEILTYQKLLELDIDSVKISKEKELDTNGKLSYRIEFLEVGSFDEYSRDNNIG